MGVVNQGHGHVFPRPDGARVRCGGPRICPDCAKDEASVDRAHDPETVARWFHEAFRDRLRSAGVAGVPLRDAAGDLVSVALVDSGGEPKGRWYCNAGGYAANSNGYLHRMISGAVDDQLVDHINGDRLDNRRANLRLVDGQRNGQNRASTGGRSSHRGVAWHAKAGRWRAYGTVNGRQTHLGLFSEEGEAAAAARAWRIENMAATVEDRAADWPQEYLRHAAALPWSEVPEANRALMVATVAEVLAKLNDPRGVT